MLCSLKVIILQQKRPEYFQAKDTDTLKQTVTSRRLFPTTVLYVELNIIVMTKTRGERNSDDDPIITF